MNYKIANKEICNALIKREIVRGYDIDKDTVFVTADGCCGFIIPKAEIVYNITKMHEMNKLLDFSDYLKPENEIKPTMIYVRRDGDFCRRFDGKDWKVFIKDKYLKKLDESEYYQFFQNYEEGKDMTRQMIVAAVKKQNKYIPVMVLLPVIIFDYESSEKVR